MLPVISNFLSRFSPAKPVEASNAVVPIRAPLQALGINDFLNLDIPPREMLLAPILPERSLAMLYCAKRSGQIVACPFNRIGYRDRSIVIALVCASTTEGSLCRWRNAPRLTAGATQGNIGWFRQ